ncbi:uncharacterized protein LOC130219669 [Danio aesculapii]|uniref:uncharacterized protein LOC130219669 n=1 Tax=Danio aesculapii TaxID=1142201 RepID=UPI0024BFE283|nr:uncharacterized protein LOC130219669 [Danio aesculapii]
MMALLFRLKLKQDRNEPKWILMLIVAFHMIVTPQHVEAFGNPEPLRVLSVGVRGQSSVSIADLLSGNKEQKQKDGEIVKTPVMIGEGRRLTLVTGPNLCEEDTARQNFTTALFLSSPGPHAVLMLLHLEDPQAEPPCDLLQQAQELLGAEVLQYCIVLLQQNQQERLTGASRGIAGDMINACGGRFHIIPDAQTKPAALLEEIDKLVWLNDRRFYSAFNKTHLLQLEKQELLKRLQEIDAKLGENQVFCATSNTLGVVGWCLIVSLIAIALVTQWNIKILAFEAALAGLVVLMASLRNALNPHVACALNLALCSTYAAASIKYLPPMLKLKNVEKRQMEFLFTVGLGVTLGSITSIRTLFDVFITSCAALGVAFGAFVFLQMSLELKNVNIREIILLFMLCAVGAELALLCVIVLKAVFGVTLAIILSIIATVFGFRGLDPSVQGYIIDILTFLGFFPCCFVFTGSVVLVLDVLLSYVQVFTEYLIGSVLFYTALLIGSLLLAGSPRS